VETTNANISYLVDEKKIADLPLNERNYTQLATLQPGVIPIVGNLTRTDISAGHGIKMSIGGSGTLFGLAAAPNGDGVYFVDDGNNTLNTLQ